MSSSNLSARDSTLVRASILDVALQLGVQQGSRVAHWMFDDPEEEQDDVRSPLVKANNDEPWDLLHYYVSDNKRGDGACMSPTERAEAAHTISDLFSKSASAKRAAGHSRTMSAPSVPAFDLCVDTSLASRVESPLSSAAPWRSWILAAYGIDLPNTPSTSLPVDAAKSPVGSFPLTLATPSHFRPKPATPLLSAAPVIHSQFSAFTPSSPVINTQKSPLPRTIHSIIPTHRQSSSDAPPYSPPHYAFTLSPAHSEAPSESATWNLRPGRIQSKALPPIPQFQEPPSPALSHSSTETTSTTTTLVNSPASKDGGEAGATPLHELHVVAPPIRVSSLGAAQLDASQQRGKVPQKPSNVELSMPSVVRSTERHSPPPDPRGPESRSGSPTPAGVAGTAPLKIRKHSKLSIPSSPRPRRSDSSNPNAIVVPRETRATSSSGTRLTDPMVRVTGKVDAPREPRAIMPRYSAGNNTAARPLSLQQRGRLSPFPAQPVDRNAPKKSHSLPAALGYQLVDPGFLPST
ncbi:hypothetical protein HGRIS_010704 [Hohenbuehelia grisea]|uniref:Uncharacterized protein n=1 Tax=Hohenbuehelia grisea TaxID=104357 RepID=A0ABR3IXT0_9AGAR